MAIGQRLVLIEGDTGQVNRRCESRIGGKYLSPW